MTRTQVEMLNEGIARTLRDQELIRLRTSPYQDLLKYIDNPSSTILNGPDGKRYQIETQVFWDTKKSGNIRVMVSVDDGGLTSFKPLCGDFIISPDGSFVGEDSF
jgi:hypothetical protein